MTDKEEIKKHYEELIAKLDLKKALEKWMKEFILYGEAFPPIYLNGETPPKRYGFSGEEI